MELLAKDRYGELETGKTFREVAKVFETEYEATTHGHRSPKWVQGHKDRIRLHLMPYFGKKSVSSITSGTVQQYRVHRMTKPADWDDDQGRAWKPPARNTIHNEVVTLSMVLKTAQRHGWLDNLPDLSDPYRRSSKVEHRPWFTPNEYKQLYTATRKNAAEPKSSRYKWHAEQLHDYVLFMANTGLRPDEAKLLEFRDVDIVTDEWSGKRILEIEVRGKRGVGYCKSMPGAVKPFQRLVKRNKPEQTDLVFPIRQNTLFNNILAEENLKHDRDGNPRTAYSLRHTYICLRLMEGADIYQIAKNCRTSVEMIEKYYASHIKTSLDASAINRRRLKPGTQVEMGTV